MDKKIIIDFYSRKDVKQAILKFCKDREVAVRYDTFYGKRPEIAEYESDIDKFVRSGATSFHISEELWANPLVLSTSLSSEEKNQNRIGWDLILDLDGVDFKYAKIVAVIIIDYLKNKLNIFNVSIKFSGNKGFHIAIPSKAFSSSILGLGLTKDLFPKAPQKISYFLMRELEDKIIDEILKEDNSIELISNRYSISIEDLIIEKNGKKILNYRKLIEIDTILITSRHLFRAPYSFNEKSGLVSVPIDSLKISEFEKVLAIPSNVFPDTMQDFEFLSYNPQYGCDADSLLLKAYEENDEEELDKIYKNVKILKYEKDIEKFSQFDKKIRMLSDYSDSETYEISEFVEFDKFPEVITYMLNNDFKDGKKRVLFVLLTFLYSLHYETKQIENIIEDWSKKQSSKLQSSYISSQLEWFNNQKGLISPPNYSNENYYKNLGIPIKIIEKDVLAFKGSSIKNPIHYVFVMLKNEKKKATVAKSNT